MNFREMTTEPLIERRNQLAVDLEAPDADLDAIESEARAIREELERRAAEEARRNEIRNGISNGQIPARQVETGNENRQSRTPDEIRNSQEYIHAYANYIRTGNDNECRALLTTNASGTVQAPDVVYSIVKTAWDKEGIMRRVKKTFTKANLKVQFELSATDADFHTEGSGAASEETLILGTVSLVPATIMKWISISKEVLDLDDGSFLEYVYSELTYKIAKKAADSLVAKIVACGTVSTSTCPSVPVVVATTVGMSLVASAIGNLSDEANDPTIIMNKLTWSEFKKTAYANGYGADPFEGLDVEFNNSLKSFDAASTGDTYMIVGDLGFGAQANFTNGEAPKVIIDELTLATSDMVRVIGRNPIAEEVIAAKAFVKVTK